MVFTFHLVKIIQKKICTELFFHYLCNPFRREQYWRDGRVVECGGLENR